MKIKQSTRQYLKDGFCDYRELRLHNLTSPRFRHLLLLTWWAVHGIIFFAVEQIFTERNWTIMHAPLDDLIPFCEWFVFPYMFWFVFMCGMLLFTALFDVPAFRKMMVFIMVTYTSTLLIYLIFPTAQDLRPDIDSLGRKNFLTVFMEGFYAYDTNTNVCPSIHVLGAIAVLTTSWHCKIFRRLSWQLFFWIMTLLIILSTVFLKQHSVLDIPPAILLSLIAYPPAYHGKELLARIRRRVSNRKEK